MTLNEAIYKVITTQFKKDMREAVELVEEAGYEINKSDGRFYVRNPKTQRFIESKYSQYRDITTLIGNRGEILKFRYTCNCHFDFVGYLNKELNHVWYVMRNERAWYVSPTRKKYEKLQEAKRYLRYREEAVEKTKKDLADLQARLERDIEERVRYEQMLAETRKNLGLKPRR